MRTFSGMFCVILAIPGDDIRGGSGPHPTVPPPTLTLPPLARICGWRGTQLVVFCLVCGLKLSFSPTPLLRSLMFWCTRGGVLACANDPPAARPVRATFWLGLATHRPLGLLRTLLAGYAGLSLMALVMQVVAFGFSAMPAAWWMAVVLIPNTHARARASVLVYHDRQVDSGTHMHVLPTTWEVAPPPGSWPSGQYLPISAYMELASVPISLASARIFVFFFVLQFRQKMRAEQFFSPFFEIVVFRLRTFAVRSCQAGQPVLPPCGHPVPPHTSAPPSLLPVVAPPVAPCGVQRRHHAKGLPNRCFFSAASMVYVLFECQSGISPSVNKPTYLSCVAGTELLLYFVRCN